MSAQEKPRIFAKFSSSVVGPGGVIHKPKLVQKLDYEAELAVVLGRRARDVPESEAMRVIAGYTLVNDVSARELQFDISPPQTSFAKGMDGFCPMGPCLATIDEFDDPHALQLRCWVNDEMVQDGNTRDMTFFVPFLVSYLSRYLTLEPGDVIATGTPPGVGAFRKPPVYLKIGDRVRIEVPGIGSIENPVSD